MGVRLLTVEHERVVVPSDPSVGGRNDAATLEGYMSSGDASALDIGDDADWFVVRPLTDAEVARAEAYADTHCQSTAMGQRAWLQVLSAAIDGGSYDATAREAAEAALSDAERRLMGEFIRHLGFMHREMGRLGYVSGPVAPADFMRLPGLAREQLGRHVSRVSTLPKGRASSSDSPSDTPTTRAATDGGAETAHETTTSG